jgi:hypothetical protein
MMKRRTYELGIALEAAIKVMEQIASRAVFEYDQYNIVVSHRDILMDLMACHFRYNPLRLDDLLAADSFNFMHDIGGINKHLNRETYQLMDHFSPRFAKRP